MSAVKYFYRLFSSY